MTARRTAGRTVTAAIPSIDVVGSVAVMVVAPVATAVTSPCDPDELDTVAVAVLDDAQVTESVRSCVLPSE